MCRAQEITPFRLTGVEGYATMRYLRDTFVTEQPAAGGAAGSRSRQSQGDMREEVFIMTHSYAYHPNLVSMDIGGGPILQRGTFTTDAGDTGSQGMLYNLTGRATILRDKPYRGSLFYEHLNPTLSIAPGQVLTQENNRYGFDFSLLAPVTPVPLHLDASRSHFRGSGADRIIDDQIDRFDLRASRSYGTFGSTQLQYQVTRQESMSGSPNAPIQATTSNGQGLNLDSRFQFGSARQYDLLNLVTINTQNYTLTQGALPERKDVRVLLDLRGRHSDKLHTFGFYNYSGSNQGDLASTHNSMTAGMSYWPNKELATTLSLRADDNQTRQFAATSRGIDGSARYQRPLLAGVGQASYAFRYDQRGQQATANQTSVIGEPITLTGTTSSTLAHQRVTAGSVLVSNTGRTQTFVEDRDYTLTVVGLDTRVQRLIGGNIVDGQDVLVDYSYDVGGTYSYTQADQTLNVNWGYRNYVNVYFRRFDAAPHLTSGAPLFPLNTVRSNLYGARADFPFKLGFELTIGGGFERENRSETIAPYRRTANDLYLQTEDPVFRTGNIRISTRHTKVDYENSVQNVNLTGYDFRYWSRLWFGLEVSADASYELDTGSPVPRRRIADSLKAKWRYRKASLTMDFGRTRESQGEFERTRTLAQILARRDF